MAQIPLEDTFGDIIGKAMRGLQISVSALAEQAGLSAAEAAALKEGEFSEAAARKAAPVLHLNADALVAMGAKTYEAAPVALTGLAQFNTQFDDMTVNAYVAWDPASRDAVVFDTGADCDPILELVAREKLAVRLILLTHTHGDHIYDLDRLKEKTSAAAYVGNREPLEGAEPFAEGTEFSAGTLHIETRLTWGHSQGGITYVVRGLAHPVAIVGDAIFAGSMGGGGVSYTDALRTNREEIMTLPDDTIICPGHGPLTTVGEQKRANPFLAR